MPPQDWLLVGILLAVSSVPFATGSAGSQDVSYLFAYVALAVGLGGYTIARLNASASRD